MEYFAFALLASAKVMDEEALKKAKGNILFWFSFVMLLLLDRDFYIVIKLDKLNIIRIINI